MDTLATMDRVMAEATKVIHGTTPDQLGNATPCTEWSVRDVINHITGGSHMFSIAVEEGSIPDEKLGELLTGDNLGDDYKGAWDAAAARAQNAFTLPGALDKMVKLPFGEMPGGVALAIAVFDVTTHVCDIATSTGQSISDVALLDEALETGKQMIGAELRQPGLFDAEQPCPPGGSATDKLLAFAGRKV